MIPENLCVGVDGNRNFEYHWDEGGSSDLSCSGVYHGPEPFSEVELQNMRDYIYSFGDSVVYYQNLHSNAQMIMYPWAYECTLEGNVDAADQDALARRVMTRQDSQLKQFKQSEVFFIQGEDAITEATGVSYEVGPLCQTIYEASGNSIDWAYGMAGIKYSFTMEMRNGPDGFVVPPEDIDPNGRDLLAFHTSAARDIMAEFGAS